MNQIEEQKGLIEYLEAALAAARKHLAADPEKISRIERELFEARAEFDHLSERPVPPVIETPSLLNREIHRRAAPVEFQLNLQLQSEPWYRSFANNIKSIFVNETKVYNISAQPIHTNLMVEVEPWYRTLGNNLKAIVKPEPKSYAITSKPIATDLILDEQPWYKTVFSQLKYVFVREERPEIQVTAQPVEVDEIFKEYKFRSSSLAFSMIAHAVAVLAILFVPMWLMKQAASKAKTQAEVVDLSQLTLDLPPKPDKSGGGGGGGRREPTPPSKGKLPRPSDKQLTPPTPKIVNLDPVLPVEPTVIVPQLSTLPNINVANYGDPLGIPGPPSSGPGTGGGIGTGAGGGVGPGKGGGVGPGEGGGIGGGVFRVGGGVSAPSIVYRVEPTYSEEARKAKYQGVVVLSAIVRKDGTIEILKVIRGLGLGLDENAISALKQWKFRPGMKNGVPVDVALNIEVNFSLR
ncbi:MAG: energy transducer TonB [Acidobacteria bacterium]|nr:energy transducer TonB [Acidobacteriota bacterium]MCI0721914.1 energy transducer TonB [Acidobacteriota bacterium]